MTRLPSFLPRAKVAGEGHRVTTFELFFDLVFVFAFTQVTQFMAEAHSPIGVLRAMVILLVLWLSWSSYAWLANQTHADDGIVRLGMCVAMLAMFTVALVIPESFEDFEGGLFAPVVFVVAYFAVRLSHTVLYLFAAGDDTPLRRQVLITAIPMVISCAGLFAGALIGGPSQTWIWTGAVLVDAVAIYITAKGGDWRLHSPAHWAERHGLVVILALGESIVAIGVGAAHEAISVPILVGGAFAVLLSIGLWWLYFDVTATAAEHRLTQVRGSDRAQLASDAYTYLHFPLVAGIVISALGVEDVIAHASGSEPLGWFGAWALFGGTSLYLAAHAFFWRRVGASWKVWRLGGGTLLLALLPIGAALHPLAALGIVLAVVVGVAATERRRYAEIRARIRQSRPD